MTEEKKPIQVEFAPGCFDSFEGTQEELDEFIKEITEMFNNKSKEEIEFMGRELTDEDFEELPDDLKAHIIETMMDEDHIENRNKGLQ